MMMSGIEIEIEMKNLSEICPLLSEDRKHQVNEVNLKVQVIFQDLDLVSVR